MGGYLGLDKEKKDAHVKIAHCVHSAHTGSLYAD